MVTETIATAYATYAALTLGATVFANSAGRTARDSITFKTAVDRREDTLWRARLIVECSSTSVKQASAYAYSVADWLKSQEGLTSASWSPASEIFVESFGVDEISRHLVCVHCDIVYIP